MAGGRGDHGDRLGQVPMEEAPHRDRSIEDAVLIEDLQRQIVELTLLLQLNSLLEVANRNQDRRMRHGSSRSKNRMSRGRRLRHESASYTDIYSHHHLHNIFSDNISPSPHPQQRDNHSKDWNSLHCCANPEHLCEEDEGMLFQTPPIFDEYPDDEHDVSTLMGETEAKMDAINNPSNIDEDYIGDLLSSLEDALSLKVVANVLLRSKPLCLTNIEILKSYYNEPFLQPRSKSENTRFVVNKTLGWNTIFGDELLQQNFKMTQQNLLAKLQKFKFKILVFVEYMKLDSHKIRPIDLIVLDMKFYCLKEVYKDKKKKKI